jgi:cell division transport system permease protein
MAGKKMAGEKTAHPPSGTSGGNARNRLLPEGRVAGPMPWVIAIMMFLTVLAGAAGLGLGHGMQSLRADLAGRLTVQVVEADAQTRDETVRRIVARLRALPGVDTVAPVDQARLAEQLRPWLGADMDAADLPIPALVDVALKRGAGDMVAAVTRIARQVTPDARVEPHAAFLGPLSGLVGTLALLAGALVLLMAIATGAVVVLAARSAHASHRGTIEILHQLGATDVQIARLFQRRIALDALLGCAVGFVCAIIVIVVVGHRLSATGSDLLRAVFLPDWAWAALVALPVAGIILAMLAARFTVLRALGRAL